MSGHNKWSQIKRQKGVTDARRGAAFTKAANVITIASKEAGGNPETNFKLRLAIDNAKKLNMPKGNIERAITRGSGTSKEGANLEEIIYEGFGPGGASILVESVTDNRSRTAQEVRSIFERSGGNLAGPGSVSHNFKVGGEITVKLDDSYDSDRLMLLAAESGADDVEITGNEAVVYCSRAILEKVKRDLSEQNLEIIETTISRKPISTIKIEEKKESEKILSLMNKLEETEDVQKVYANFDIPDEILEEGAA